MIATKMTKKQTQIFKTLQSLRGFATAQQIHETLPDINLTTIYRTLEKFEQQHLIQKIILANQEAAYEFSQHKHHHVMCSSCNTIEHIHIDKNLVQQIKKIAHFKQDSIEIVVRGTCK